MKFWLDITLPHISMDLFKFAGTNIRGLFSIFNFQQTYFRLVLLQKHCNNICQYQYPKIQTSMCLRFGKLLHYFLVNQYQATNLVTYPTQQSHIQYKSILWANFHSRVRNFRKVRENFVVANISRSDHISLPYSC